MPLFPQESAPGPSGGPDAAQRMSWTREGGTRRLVLGFVGLIVLWLVVDKVHDHLLLENHWKPLTPDLSGMTVVGTLDARGDYDRNMFKIVQASKEFRVELTDFGWRSIFDEKNGKPQFSEQAGNAIKSALDLDDLTGAAMLEPYLASGVAHLQGKAGWNRMVDLNMPIVVEGNKPGSTVQKGTLGELISEYSKKGVDKGAEEASDVGGSGTTHEVEHGLTIPADTLANACPVVLTGADFNNVYVEESPPSLVGGKTWTLHLGLTPEGRSRFYQWSHDHNNENLVFILNHEVVAAGRMPETLDVKEWGLGPLHDETNVKKLEAYVRSKMK